MSSLICNEKGLEDGTFQDRIYGTDRFTGVDPEFVRWWKCEGQFDADSNLTRDEIVWKAARKDLLRKQRKRGAKRKSNA